MVLIKGSVEPYCWIQAPKVCGDIRVVGMSSFIHMYKNMLPIVQLQCYIHTSDFPFCFVLIHTSYGLAT